jgi:RNA polymerase sigma factor (sigma-70 family)
MGQPIGCSAPRQLAETEAAGRISRATALLEYGEATLRTIARRYSVSHDEAEDAFARAVETLLTKGPDVPLPRLMSWMKVVTRHEAIHGVRHEARRRPALAAESGEVIDPDWFATPRAGPEEELDRRERVARYAERLAELKPQERRALALFGAGCSYAEIQAITGWTYTKVNRCVNEGRAALRKQLEAAA